MNLFIKIVRRVFLGSFLLYGYNLIAVNFNMIIPINIFTIGFVTVLGVPSILAILLFKVLIL